MSFYGNPNVTITAISTAGGIVCPTTSGSLPFFVHVSASAITATGTSNPYEDLEYSWDFGDASGTEVFNQALDSTGLLAQSTAVNMNSAQTGPDAAYCYRTAGTYTITLTIRGKNGASFTTATVTQNVTASAYTGTNFYVDSVNGNDSWDGTAGQFVSGTTGPKKSQSAIATFIGATQTQAITLNLAYGSSWYGTSVGIELQTAFPVRVKPYTGASGAGANPIIGMSAGGDVGALYMNNGGTRQPTDIVFSNIKFDISGGTTTTSINISAGNSSSNKISRVYFDNCTASSSVSGFSENVAIGYSGQENNDVIDEVGLWGGTISNGMTTNEARHALFGGSRNWFFVYGTSISGSGGQVPSGDHHIYPEIVSHHAYRYITFASGTGRNFCININVAPGLTPIAAQYVCISDNLMTGVLRGHDGSNQNNNTTDGTFQYFVSQRNVFKSLTGVGVVQCYSALSWTVRDNLVFGCSNFYAPSGSVGTILKGQTYRNLVYYNVSDGAAAFDLNGAGTWSNAQVHTDNVTYDTRTAADIFTGSFAGMATWTIDRNQYYAPSDTDSAYLFDGVTAKTFAQWQTAGFDAGGSSLNPGWLDPANGNFATTVTHHGGKGLRNF